MKYSNAKVNKQKYSKKTGRGLINKAINHLPFELHLPGYQYCGPGTRLKERLRRGDPGRNQLDRACRLHDIAYDKFPEDHERKMADQMLLGKAIERAKSKDASLGEKVAASTVAGLMTFKNAVGSGFRTKNKKKTTKTKRLKKKNNINKILHSTVKTVKNVLNDKRPKTVENAVHIALKTAKIAVKKHSNAKTKTYSPEFERVIPVPKIGGVLPLIPIFAGLSALGALAGGSAAIANAVVTANNAKKQLHESERHNQVMEAIAIGTNKHGRGVYLKPYRAGLGLYMNKKDSRNISKNS